MTDRLFTPAKLGCALLALLPLCLLPQVGRPAPAQPRTQVPPRLSDFIGLNGHTVQFKPELYQPVCRLVRDYHPVEWDLGKDTSALPEFPFAKNRVDWSKVYGSWRDKDFRINVSLMFESIPRTNWTILEADARAYGEAFAREFGPSGKRALVESVEIGNEPGKWSDPDYTRTFKAMAAGLRAGDAKLKIGTCNLATGKSGDYEKSVECVASAPDLFDVLTIHTYPQLEGWPTWRRSYPEDPKLPRYLQDVEDLCHWRDTNVPNKPIWITEFGYDSTTKPAPASGDFARWVGVSDTQQAQWLVRSLLVFSAMPVERAYIYFFNDDDQPSVHASSGITRHFKPKPSFHALSHLQRTLGEFRYARPVKNETNGLRVHEYRSDSGRIIWTAWLATGEGKSLEVMLEHAPGKIAEIQQMPLGPDVQKQPFKQSSGNVQIRVGESPLFLVFQKD